MCVCNVTYIYIHDIIHFHNCQAFHSHPVSAKEHPEDQEYVSWMPPACGIEWRSTLGQTKSLLLKRVIYSWFSHQKWWFYIVMLVYQRSRWLSSWQAEGFTWLHGSGTAESAGSTLLTRPLWADSECLACLAYDAPGKNMICVWTYVRIHDIRDSMGYIFRSCWLELRVFALFVPWCLTRSTWKVM